MINVTVLSFIHSFIHSFLFIFFVFLIFRRLCKADYMDDGVRVFSYRALDALNAADMGMYM